MTRLAPSHRARTKIEIMVVVLVIVSFAGIALTFLTGVRETAKNVSCVYNLGLIGKAMHAYGDKTAVVDLQGKGHRVLPPARIAEDYATWAGLIIPFAMATKKTQEWDAQRTFADQSDEVRGQIVPIYYCPSRLRPTRLSAAPVGALGDYAAAAGDGNAKHPWTGADANGAIIEGEVLEKKDDRVLRWRSRTHFDSLKRGISATILVGDKHVPVGGFGQAAFGDASIYDSKNPANYSRVLGPGFGLARSPVDPMNNNFGGAHPGVCNFVMADTSVRSLATTINEDVLGRLIVREE